MNFRSNSKEAISDHFNDPEYAVLRPSDFRYDLRGDDQGANRTIRGGTIPSKKKLAYRRDRFHSHRHIESSSRGELIGHGRGMGMVINFPTERWHCGNNSPITWGKRD